LDNLNPADVILILDRSSPIEERSQILRAGQARNFQFVQDKTYYEAVYDCICRNSEAQQAAPAVQQHGQELPAAEPENEQDAEADQEATPFVQEHGQQQLSPVEADRGMEPVDDDGEAMEKQQDADYFPSDSDGADESDDTWLRFPYFFEENITDNLDLPANDTEIEEEEMPAVQQPAINLDEEQVPEDDTYDDHDADYFPSDSDGANESDDTCCSFHIFLRKTSLTILIFGPMIQRMKRKKCQQFSSLIMSLMEKKNMNRAQNQRKRT
jgi:hypothetical protein